MKKLFTLFLILFSTLFGGTLAAQELEFKSFEFNVRDAAARTNAVVDLSENPCALLRVYVAVENADFKGNLGILEDSGKPAPRGSDGYPKGNLGVRGKAKKIRYSEYLMYIPAGSKSITVNGEGFLPFTYHFNQEIKGLCTYELYLQVPELGPKKHKVESNYVTLEVTPKNATVLIDNVVHTLTDGKLLIERSLGRHTYRVAAPQYHTQSGEFEVVDTETTSLKIDLKLAFGWLDVQTTPAGATVMIDSEVKGTTPCKIKLESGNYFMQLLGEGYIAYGENITITDGQTRQVRSTLKANFAQITIQAPYAHSEIWLRGEKVATGKWSGRLNAGTYAVESRTEGYEPCKENIEVEAEVARTYTLQSPTPIYGLLKIVSDPFGATIKLDGKVVGTTPWQNNEVLIGEHTLEIEKEGYSLYTQTFTLTQEQPLSLKATLSIKEEIVDDQPFLTVETMPSFQGGDLLKFRNWVMSNLRYPQVAQENGISGRVVLSFVIERDGSLTNIVVLQSPDSSLSEEAIRVLNQSPKWSPGKQGDQAVRVHFTLPVEFHLIGEKKRKPTYKVGDYYNVNGKEGVVFWVDETGKHGKIVSMKESSYSMRWTSDGQEQKRLIGADSKTDGAKNMEAVKNRIDWQLKYPAFKCCADLGEGWYLPAKEELQSISKVKDSVNKTLKDQGGIEMLKFYWSSTESNLMYGGVFCAWLVLVSNGDTNYDPKNRNFYVRAVSAF